MSRLIERITGDGLLVLNKPVGDSSFQVANQIRKRLKIKRVGHAGTLDPLASGVLLLLIGQATKISSFVMGGIKEYHVEGRLGIETDSYDMTGNVLRISEKIPHAVQDIAEVLQQFIGTIHQVPPMFSAVHFEGRRLYEYARLGIAVPRQARQIQIFELELLSFSPPSFSLRVRCSKGTYIRSLISDIGQQLGCGACVNSLIRTESSGFTLEQAHTADEVIGLARQGILDSILFSIDQALEKLPTSICSEERLRKNQVVSVKRSVNSEQNDDESSFIRLLNEEGELLAIAETIIDRTHENQYNAVFDSHCSVVRWVPQRSSAMPI